MCYMKCKHLRINLLQERKHFVLKLACGVELSILVLNSSRGGRRDSYMIKLWILVILLRGINQGSFVSLRVIITKFDYL